MGRNADLLMPPPPQLAAAAGRNVLLVDSTYGKRQHPPATDNPAQLAKIIRDAIARGGKVLMPGFAVGRTQALVVALQRLKRAGEIPYPLPI